MLSDWGGVAGCSFSESYFLQVNSDLSGVAAAVFRLSDGQGRGSAGCWSDRDSSASRSGQSTPSKKQNKKKERLS